MAAWPFRRNPTKTQFGRDLLRVREVSEERIAQAPDLEEPNRLVLLSASAGATVALGGYGAAMQQQFKDGDEYLPTAHGDLAADRIVQFAKSLSHTDAIEAAYRVLTWAVSAEMAVFFWRPNYAFEMTQLAEAFGFNNIFEETVVAIGGPVDDGANPRAVGDRFCELVKGSLVCMVAAALAEEIDPDDPFVAMYLPAWLNQFNEAKEVARERLTQLAPEGLPIWEA